MPEERGTDPAIISLGLQKVRNRRWILWLTILIYIPGLLIALEAGASGATLGWLFACWIVLTCVAVGLATVVKCPCCGNAYHTNGPTFLPLRRCVHCGLALRADRTG